MSNANGFEMNQWTLALRVPVEFGAGCLQRLPNHLHGYRRVLLVTGKHAMQAAGVTPRVEALLASAGVACRVYAGVSAEPNYQEVEEAGALARSWGADAVAGLGGGSALDAAKAIAVAATHEGPIMEHTIGGPRQITAAALPILAITSTSGTGSHVGRVAVLSDRAQHIKRSLASDFLYPRAAICDPEILRTMSPETTAVTGFDAFAHALEGYLSRAENPLGKVCALEAMRIIYTTLPQAIARGDDLDLRGRMGWADTLAGISLALHAVTIPHAIGMIIGGRYGIPHGRAVASVTVAALEHSRSAAITRLADVARALGCTEPGTEEARADWAIEAIRQLIRDAGLAGSIADYGVPEADWEGVGAEARKAFGMRIDQDPRPADAAGIAGILRRSAALGKETRI